jgi:hypothetical protein
VGSSYILVAPVDGWSERIVSVPVWSFMATYDGDVVIRDDEGRTFYSGPKIPVNIGHPKYTEIQSRVGRPVMVLVTKFR